MRSVESLDSALYPTLRLHDIPRSANGIHGFIYSDKIDTFDIGSMALDA